MGGGAKGWGTRSGMSWGKLQHTSTLSQAIPNLPPDDNEHIREQSKLCLAL